MLKAIVTPAIAKMMHIFTITESRLPNLSMKKPMKKHPRTSPKPKPTIGRIEYLNLY